MFTEARGITHFIISIWPDFVSYVFVCCFSCLGGGLNGPPGFEIYVTILIMGLEIIFLLGMLGKFVNFIIIYSYLSIGGKMLKSLISMHIYFARAVLSALLHRILDVVKSAVRVVK